jgi:hypothetical protein
MNIMQGFSQGFVLFWDTLVPWQLPHKLNYYFIFSKKIMNLFLIFFLNFRKIVNLFFNMSKFLKVLVKSQEFDLSTS